jgi:DNA replication protein DnaC
MTGNRLESASYHRRCGTVKLVVLQSKTSNIRSHQTDHLIIPRGEGRIRAARFPSRKSLEEFDFDHAPGLKRDTIAHLGTLDFVTAKDNVVFLGPPGTGKPT